MGGKVNAIKFSMKNTSPYAIFSSTALIGPNLKRWFERVQFIVYRFRGIETVKGFKTAKPTDISLGVCLVDLFGIYF